ncbi:hypothetical protein RD110_05315 [Rhodoferax koreense]|uniref:OmpA-like domain-containing protein n=1 Tax=Rhodoferax koreensis TaxID=1842727 RepID=A0A1P8JSD8_9BURK|nr:OmpA family protein [Rhodoferax koreense]APW36683.1 hypothetical protein RD110_05315 [Rhodoferax koreense]
MTAIRRLGWSVPLLAALLAGCAAPRVEVVLLPQEDGSPSAVQVSSGNATEKLSRPYERFVATPGRPPLVDQADPAAIARDFESLFAMRPAKPQRFVLYFEAGDATLSDASQATIGQIFEAAGQRPGADILVVGHTDTRGSTDANDQLSLQRAQQVRTTLMQRQLFVLHQVPVERIEAIGRGERELAVPTADEVDEPRNRRVEIWVR